VKEFDAPSLGREVAFRFDMKFQGYARIDSLMPPAAVELKEYSSTLPVLPICILKMLLEDRLIVGGFPLFAASILH
jgi:hypothetical protein